MASHNGKIRVRKRQSNSKYVYLAGAGVLAYVAWKSGLVYYAALELGALREKIFGRSTTGERVVR